MCSGEKVKRVEVRDVILALVTNPSRQAHRRMRLGQRILVGIVNTISSLKLLLRSCLAYKDTIAVTGQFQVPRARLWTYIDVAVKCRFGVS